MGSQELGTPWNGRFRKTEWLGGIEICSEQRIWVRFRRTTFSIYFILSSSVSIHSAKTNCIHQAVVSIDKIWKRILHNWLRYWYLFYWCISQIMGWLTCYIEHPPYLTILPPPLWLWFFWFPIISYGKYVLPSHLIVYKQCRLRALCLCIPLSGDFYLCTFQHCMQARQILLD